VGASLGASTARVGESIAWTLEDESVKVLRVLALLYQPEAAGHWHL
jgi:hypothetical protein